MKIQEDYRALQVKTCCQRGCNQKLTIEPMRLLPQRFATKGEKQQRKFILDEITQSPLLESKLFIDGQRVCISTCCLLKDQVRYCLVSIGNYIILIFYIIQSTVVVIMVINYCLKFS